MQPEHPEPTGPATNPLPENLASPLSPPTSERRVGWWLKGIDILRSYLHGRRADGRWWTNWRVVCVLLLALIPFPIWLATTGHANVPPVSLHATPPQLVSVARVGREDLYNAITLSAEFRPYVQVELHAKVSGYLESMNVDLGDPVKAGQLLAKLEVPELRDELRQGLAAQKRAEAEYRNAHLVYTSLLAVEKEHPNLVAQQEVEAAEAKDLIAEAAIASAKAAVEKYQTMLDYTRICAPFDGVITRRFADPGALIQAGTTSATQSLPLLCVSDNYRLRLDFPVSVSYVKDIQLGASVDVQVQSLGGKSFKGTISRTTKNVEEATRTMLTEIEVPNPDLELVPGMYATVVINVERRSNALAIPTDAISSGQKSSVYLINRNGEIEERPVTLGLETSTKYEVTAGLKEGDLVFVGSRSQVKLGQKVEAKLGPVAQQ